MTWPPADLPIDFQNATPQENTHPDAHNATNQTINADLVPEIIRVGELAETIGLYLPLTGGTLTGGLQVDGNLTVKSGGGATNVAIGFNGLDGMGIYSSIANNYMRFAVAGGQRLAIKEDVVVVNNDLQVDGQIKAPTTADTGAPNYTFTGATGAGMWCYSNDLMGFAASGVEFFRADSSTATFKGNLQVDGQTKAQNGTNAAPAYSFNSDPDTGIYQPAADALELTVGGERAVYFGKSTNNPTGVFMPGINSHVSGPGTAPIVMVESVANGGTLIRTTSARRHLREVEFVNLDATNSVYDLKPVWYRSKSEITDPAHSFYGFVAEDVAAVDPRLVTYAADDDGNPTPETVNDHAVMALLVSAVQEQRQQISDLTARVEALEAAS